MVPQFKIEGDLSLIYKEKPATAIKHEQEVHIDEKRTLGELQDTILYFINNFSEEDRKAFKLAHITSRTTKDTSDSKHIFFLLMTFFFNSIEEQLTPEEKINWEKYEKELTNILDKMKKRGYFSNEKIKLYLLGITKGLL